MDESLQRADETRFDDSSEAPHVVCRYYRIPGSIPATGLDFDNPRCVIQTTKSELILKLNCVCVECADSCNSQSIACFTNSGMHQQTNEIIVALANDMIMLNLRIQP